jgi:hypothetical protein
LTSINEPALDRFSLVRHIRVALRARIARRPQPSVTSAKNRDVMQIPPRVPAIAIGRPEVIFIKRFKAIVPR